MNKDNEQREITERAIKLMKTVTVYCDKDLALKYVEAMPEEPNKDRIYNDSLTTPGSYVYAIGQYKSALQFCKDSSIPFEDQEAITERLAIDWGSGEDVEPDTFYTIDINGEVEIVAITIPCPENNPGCCVYHFKSVARLKPELNSISEEQEEKSEDKFKKCLCLLRDLSDLQNGPPLERYREEWEETMEKVYTFLNQHEIITRKGNTL